MRFDIITIFPNVFSAYFNESILRRAIQRKLIEIKIHNLRNYTTGKHQKVDDRVYGGGPGMVMKVEPLIKVLSAILLPRHTMSKSKKVLDVLIILLSASGEQLNSKIAANFAKKCNRIIFICGHYEGVDERIKKVIHDLGFNVKEISVGSYVLTGGELPAMIVIDAVSRHIFGVLGKAESLEEKRYGVGVPVYTRPEVYKYKNKKYRVPKTLLSGNHKKIEEWRQSKVNLR